MARLICINGPAGIGKTTIAQRYIAEHPLALMIGEDDLISLLGGWQSHEDTARAIAFTYVKTLVAAHLSQGYDVVVPHLLVRPTEASDLADIAARQHATFFEFALITDKQTAIRRLISRGTWGEAGAPPITPADTPIIEGLYDMMLEALNQRPGTIRIPSVEGRIDETYRNLIRYVTAPEH